MCALVLGEEFDRTLDLGQDEADAALRDWIGVLWNSRRTELMTAFAGSAPALTGVFPWLPAHLEAETPAAQLFSSMKKRLRSPAT